MYSKKLKHITMALVTALLFSTVIMGCSKDKDEPSGNTDEAAAARVAGTYKGTIDDFSQEYFDATIIITKESGNKVKIAPKSGEPYSHVSAKIIAIQAIAGTDDCGGQDPQGVLVYNASQKTINFISKATASGDVIFSFEGTKQ